MKVIFSTGHGRLHIIQSAVSVKKSGHNVTVITGWIPGKMLSDKWINRIGKLVGRPNLANGIRKRTPTELSPEELKSCTLSEFLVQFLFKLSSYHFFKRVIGAVIGWRFFGWQSRRYIQDGRIFHVRSGAGRGGAMNKARSKGMKIVVDHSISHPNEMEKQLIKSAGKGGVKHNYYLGTWPSDKFWKMVVRDCEEADILVVNSEYVKWSFVQEGYPAEKIRVIQLGVSSEFGLPKQSYKSLGPIRLVFTGAFGSRKGAGIILETLEILRKANIDFYFEVVGSVMGDFLMPEWVKGTNSVKFHGHMPQSQMIPILLQSDIYVFPTYSEGSAQSVKEAMALGLPVVTTVQCGSPIENYTNGVLIEDGNAVALSEAIIKLKNDESLRQSIGENASRLIREEHTWENYGKQMSALYYELTEHRRS